MRNRGLEQTGQEPGVSGCKHKRLAGFITIVIKLKRKCAAAADMFMCVLLDWCGRSTREQFLPPERQMFVCKTEDGKTCYSNAPKCRLVCLIAPLSMK